MNLKFNENYLKFKLASYKKKWSDWDNTVVHIVLSLTMISIVAHPGQPVSVSTSLTGQFFLHDGDLFF